MRGNTRLKAADIENQQFHSFYETKIFNFALKKVPKRVESRAWACSVTFFKRNIRNWSQSRDLMYEGDAISVVITTTARTTPTRLKLKSGSEWYSVADKNKEADDIAVVVVVFF